MFANGQGGRKPVSGERDVDIPSRDTFQLYLHFDTGEQWQGNFRIMGRDRIHNMDENYVAVRVPH